MKKIIFSACFVFGALSFMQAQEYVEVMLDGKKVLMSTITGEFKTGTLPQTSSVSTSSQTYNTSTSTHGQHTVTKGETLYSISRKYGVSVAQLQQINNLSSNTLSLNQVLKIDGNSAPSTVVNTVSTSVNTVSSGASEYTVSSGDTLYKISRETHVSVAELKRINNLQSNNLQIGQRLRLR